MQTSINVNPLNRETVTSAARPRINIAVIVLIGFVLRVAHLLASVDNPFLYALSPDEDYYLAFGRNVATGGLGLDPAFAFMDPLYGYLLGALIALTGENLFVVRLLQIAIDTASIVLVAHIATTLAGRRAGLLAGGLYAIASPAVFYATLILKTTLVANIVLLWIAVALRALKTQRAAAWLALGAVTGIAILLRSNLVLLLPGALLLVLPWGTRSAGRSIVAALIVIVATLALQIPAGLRHQAITGDFALLPSNGGIVLYQVYAPDHLEGGRVMPAFVESVNPMEMQYYFVREAQRRTGREMSLDEANAYWGNEAITQIREHPAAALKHVAGNLRAFVAGLEIPNNRSLYIDRVFSLPLALSPVGFAVLAGLGVPGLVVGIRRRRETAVLLIPIAIAMITIAVFFDFSRFRFPALPCLAVAGGLFLDHLMTLGSEGDQRRVLMLGNFACLLALGSWLLGDDIADHTRLDPRRIVQAQVKSGQFDAARNALAVLLAERPDDALLHELAGFVALRSGDLQAAVDASRRAVTLNERRHIAWFNLSLALEQRGDRIQAARAAERALQIRPLADYRLQLAKLIADSYPAEAARLCTDTLAGKLDEAQRKAATECFGVQYGTINVQP